MKNRGPPPQPPGQPTGPLAAALGVGSEAAPQRAMAVSTKPPMNQPWASIVSGQRGSVSTEAPLQSAVMAPCETIENPVPEINVVNVPSSLLRQDEENDDEIKIVTPVPETTQYRPGAAYSRPPTPLPRAGASACNLFGNRRTLLDEESYPTPTATPISSGFRTPVPPELSDELFPSRPPVPMMVPGTRPLLPGPTMPNPGGFCPPGVLPTFSVGQQPMPLPYEWSGNGFLSPWLQPCPGPYFQGIPYMNVHESMNLGYPRPYVQGGPITSSVMAPSFPYAYVYCDGRPEENRPGATVAEPTPTGQSTPQSKLSVRRSDYTYEEEGPLFPRQAESDRGMIMSETPSIATPSIVAHETANLRGTQIQAMIQNDARSLADDDEHPQNFAEQLNEERENLEPPPPREANLETAVHRDVIAQHFMHGDSPTRDSSTGLIKQGGRARPLFEEPYSRRFSHQGRSICRHFLMGRCTFDKCRFAHVREDELARRGRDRQPPPTNEETRRRSGGVMVDNPPEKNVRSLEGSPKRPTAEVRQQVQPQPQPQPQQPPPPPPPPPPPAEEVVRRPGTNDRRAVYVPRSAQMRRAFDAPSITGEPPSVCSGMHHEGEAPLRTVPEEGPDSHVDTVAPTGGNRSRPFGQRGRGRGRGSFGPPRRPDAWILQPEDTVAREELPLPTPVLVTEPQAPTQTSRPMTQRGNIDEESVAVQPDVPHQLQPPGQNTTATATTTNRGWGRRRKPRRPYIIQGDSQDSAPRPSTSRPAAEGSTGESILERTSVSDSVPVGPAVTQRAEQQPATSQGIAPQGGQRGLVMATGEEQRGPQRPPPYYRAPQRQFVERFDRPPADSRGPQRPTVDLYSYQGPSSSSRDEPRRWPQPQSQSEQRPFVPPADRAGQARQFGSAVINATGARPAPQPDPPRLRSDDLTEFPELSSEVRRTRPPPRHKHQRRRDSLRRKPQRER